MPTFSVPTGCRQAMTDLHQAHSERFNKVVNKLKQTHKELKTSTRKLQQMHVNQKEDHRLIGAFMDTHNVLRGALGKAMKHSEELPDSVQTHLQAAAIHADDVHSTLVKGRRGPGIKEKSPNTKTGSVRVSGRKVDPQTHLLKTIDDIRRRTETPEERKRDVGEVPRHLIPVPKK